MTTGIGVVTVETAVVGRGRVLAAEIFGLVRAAVMPIGVGAMMTAVSSVAEMRATGVRIVLARIVGAVTVTGRRVMSARNRNRGGSARTGTARTETVKTETAENGATDRPVMIVVRGRVAPLGAIGAIPIGPSEAAGTVASGGLVTIGGPAAIAAEVVSAATDLRETRTGSLPGVGPGGTTIGAMTDVMTGGVPNAMRVGDRIGVMSGVVVRTAGRTGRGPGRAAIVIVTAAPSRHRVSDVTTVDLVGATAGPMRLMPRPCPIRRPTSPR